MYALFASTLFLISTVALAADQEFTLLAEQQDDPFLRYLDEDRKDSKCQNYASCVDSGRDSGFCCPTVRGPHRSCCPDLPPQGTCAVNERCAAEPKNYVGECCPSPMISTFMACCDDAPEEGTCTENQACYDLGLRGECCPNSLGLYLECCDNKPEEVEDGTCSENQACADLGLLGNCCPTDQDGVTLACCDDFPDEGTCSDNEYCAALGLRGSCCPTQPLDGSDPVFLDCCDGRSTSPAPSQPPTDSPADSATEPPTDSPADSASEPPTDSPTSSPTEDDKSSPASGIEGSCSSYERCAKKNLTGACCPTDDGTWLDCCMDLGDVTEEAVCTNNNKCAELDLDGLCCPTAIDEVYLDCCPEEIINATGFGGVVTKEHKLSEVGYDKYLAASSSQSFRASCILSMACSLLSFAVLSYSGME